MIAKKVQYSSAQLNAIKYDEGTVDHFSLPSSWIHIFSQYGHLSKKRSDNIDWKEENKQERKDRIIKNNRGKEEGKGRRERKKGKEEGKKNRRKQE